MNFEPVSESLDFQTKILLEFPKARSRDARNRTTFAVRRGIPTPLLRRTAKDPKRKLGGAGLGLGALLPGGLELRAPALVRCGDLSAAPFFSFFFSFAAAAAKKRTIEVVFPLVKKRAEGGRRGVP